MTTPAPPPPPPTVDAAGSERRGFQGQIKQGTATVWTCPHAHPTRDTVSERDGTSAVHCARFMLDLVQVPDLLERARTRAAEGFGQSGPDAQGLRQTYSLLASLEPYIAGLRAQLVPAP